MKVFAVLATGALLFLSQTLAAPVADSETDNTTNGGQKPGTLSTAANWGSPQCKSAALYDLCTAANAGAYCDATGFHNNFMDSCHGVCWCA
ncbi:uncharacterized protein THITE_2114499 [Thermothielavioides terrestris NRRL 8126]|uniref:Uncharacterized protein n=1 Tax=Thermothielavioides terrestris (strain ATCC 38088 / NRRL 8126) TaxID=578455 RepID=G2R038_THETT|nr:uncharacterized protein THITE_2114499 [Thermothielavioides terrestris NRRL 8126]AEO66413.1 hypothetical protein THITE_2114499 [Thermothielavioides terrestris NRRL 8126]